MLFFSTTFLYLFLPTVLFFNFVVFKKSRLLQNIFLLFASLFFYAWGEPKFVFVMIVSIIINWFFGLMVNKKRDNKNLSRLLIALDVTFNLAILFVFKYLTFTGNILDSIFGVHLPDSKYCAADWYFVFHLSGDVICYRRVSSKG